MNATNAFVSQHFTLPELAPGVYAAIATDGGAAICNAGLIDLGGRILVYDAFMTPQAARDLRHASIEHFGRPPDLVVYSHYHNDHTWGCQAFLPEAQILASQRTRELLTTEGKLKMAYYTANAAARLKDLRAQHQTGDNAAQDLLWLGYYAGLLEALPDLHVCMPGITFPSELEVHGERLTARLITFEGAHTGSDTLLHIPEAGIAFLSDLLFVGCHPYLADGDPQALMKALGAVRELEASVFVPGHGPLGMIEEVKLLMAYIEHCEHTAQALVQSGEVDD